MKNNFTRRHRETISLQLHLAEAPSTSDFRFSSHILYSNYFKLTDPTPPILHTHTHTQINVQYQSKSEPSLKPLEAGIHAKTLSRFSHGLYFFILKELLHDRKLSSVKNMFLSQVTFLLPL